MNNNLFFLIITKIINTIKFYYYTFNLLNVYCRLLIFSILVMLVLNYRFMYRSLLSNLVLCDLHSQFYLLTVIFFTSVLVSLIITIFGNKDIKLINIAISAILTITIFFVFNYICKEIFIIFMPFIHLLCLYFVNDLSVGSYKFSIKNDLFAERYSGEETGESSRRAGKRPVGSSLGSDYDSESHMQNSNSGSQFTEEVRTELMRLFQRSIYVKPEKTHLYRFISEGNSLDSRVAEAAKEAQENPDVFYYQSKLSTLQEEQRIHRSKLEQTYMDEALRQERNLEDIETLRNIHELIKTDKRLGVKFLAADENRCQSALTKYLREQSYINDEVKRLDTPFTSIYFPDIRTVQDNTEGLVMDFRATNSSASNNSVRINSLLNSANSSGTVNNPSGTVNNPSGTVNNPSVSTVDSNVGTSSSVDSTLSLEERLTRDIRSLSLMHKARTHTTAELISNSNNPDILSKARFQFIYNSTQLRHARNYLEELNQANTITQVNATKYHKEITTIIRRLEEENNLLEKNLGFKSIFGSRRN